MADPLDVACPICHGAGVVAIPHPLKPVSKRIRVACSCRAAERAEKEERK